jgi:hypothetical protein
MLVLAIGKPLLKILSVYAISGYGHEALTALEVADIFCRKLESYKRNGNSATHHQSVDYPSSIHNHI